MCEGAFEGPAYLVAGARKYGRQWSLTQLLICGGCYSRGAPDPETGKSRAAALREKPRVRWYALVGRGERKPAAPCEACGREVVRNADPLLKRVTCSRSCSTSLTRSRNGGKGSGQPCGICGTGITTGRADSRYCGAACRQKAYRRRNLVSHA